MRTYQRVCVKDFKESDDFGNVFEVKRGKEYLTSEVDKNGEVVVFTNFWEKLPVVYFAGEVKFT